MAQINMQELVNSYFALSAQEQEYFILTIAPAICRTFQKNPHSIPRFCHTLKSEPGGDTVASQLQDALSIHKEL